VIENPHNSSQQLPDDTGLEVQSNPAAETGGLSDAAAPTRPEETTASEKGTSPEKGTSADESTTTDPQAAAPQAAADETMAEDGSTEDDGAGSETTEEPAEPTSESEPVAAAEEPERGPIEETLVTDEPPKLDWYILKVQSNREDSIRESLKRRVAVAGLERYFEEIIVPVEMVSEFKAGKKRVVKRKLYPGYLVVHMEINEDTWFLVRETPGIGDFTGSAGKPTPMLPHEVSKIVSKTEEKTDEAPKLKINFNVGDRVKINEGTFDNFEGEVDSIDEASGRVTVMINIFGRSTPVELEYWQIENI
jgi:transcriptional antiterminator NusG